MGLIEIIMISISLAMDASAVSMAAAAAGFAHSRRQVFRLAFHFGLFQGLMPLLGYFLGSTVIDYISAWDHWIAFILLVVVGGRMLISGLSTDVTGFSQDPTKGWRLISLSIATSIDALALGLSFSVLSVSIWLPALLIALITALLSFLSTRIGKVLGALFGKKVERFGGLLLLGIGTRILLTHLF